jgi:alanine racemase
MTWASGDAFDTSMQNKEVVINGVQVPITGYTMDPTCMTVTGLLLASAPGDGTNLPFQIVTMSFRIQ